MLRDHWLPLLAIALLAVASRGGMIAARSAELTQERDAYLGIAAGLAEGRGYSSPGSPEPTAYRPPLYPLVLSLSPMADAGRWVGMVNLLCGIGTVWLTYALGLSLGLPRWGSVVAGGLVAVDPLLVRYASQPMTESLCALLVTGWAWSLVRLFQSPSPRTAMWCGVWLGLCALGRPTVWSAAALVVLWGLRHWRRGCPGAETGARGTFRTVVAGVVGCAVVVLPWVVRNALTFGSPILTTTHGGYTLLLGNNPAFYAEVVRQKWGTVWDGSHGPGQAAWLEGVLREQAAAGVSGEVESDAWMNQWAREHIRSDPAGFLRACGLRQSWFWNIVPLGEARSGWPVWMLWGVGLFYGALWIGALTGLIDAVRTRSVLWGPVLLIVAGFAAVHLVYWTDARMRAPLAPLLTLLAVRGYLRLTSLHAPPASHSRGMLKS